MLRERLLENGIHKLRAAKAGGRRLVEIYKFNLLLAGGHTGLSRLRNVIHTTRKVVGRKCVLFYPDIPTYKHVIYKICLLLGYRITNDPTSHCDVMVKWKDATFSARDDVLTRLADLRAVLNLECEDISKARIDAVLSQVFGYGLTIDPRRQEGKCVQKSNLNAKHDGRIIDCSEELPEGDFVYQKVVNNQIDGGLVQDIRVPVFKHQIPFLYLKYRPIEKRFSNTNSRLEIARVEDMLSPDEVEKIICFCRTLGLDYGELDVLRDKEDERLYVVDVNTTPWGPPNHISREEERIAMMKLAQAFEEVFAEPGGVSASVAC